MISPRKLLIPVASLIVAGAVILALYRPAGHDVVAVEVEYAEGVTGYLAQPDNGGTYPALVLIHEWWGLNEDIKHTARRFAAEGYVALAVDMYDGEVAADSDRARALSSAVRADVPGAMANLSAAAAFLRSHASVRADDLAAVGWCFGGGWSFQMATGDFGLDAAVVFYGQFDPEADLSNAPRILGHFGEEDAGIPLENVSRLSSALDAQDDGHAVYTYPGAGHAFFNYRGGENANYREDAANTAWSRTLKFLDGAFGG
ncbi:MAG TPA: dienelactone hydrolase family protein [Candidatus Paceibacterota bacterium]|nr:dienelactone hydrolase family protein [Candidatus Paceibacterota bacterium]